MSKNGFNKPVVFPKIGKQGEQKENKLIKNNNQFQKMMFTNNKNMKNNKNNFNQNHFHGGIMNQNKQGKMQIQGGCGQIGQGNPIKKIDLQFGIKNLNNDNPVKVFKNEKEREKIVQFVFEEQRRKRQNNL